MNTHNTPIVHGLSLTDPRCAEVLEALPGLSPKPSMQAALHELISAAIDAHTFHEAEAAIAASHGDRPAAVKLHRFLATRLASAIAKVGSAS